MRKKKIEVTKVSQIGEVLNMNPNVKDFYEFTVDDFKLEGYEYNTIEEKFEVAI